MGYEYAVAISFAGEDRDYAELLAEEFAERDLEVFYDRFEEDELWGKNLFEHLQSAYREKARFCVVLVSKAYAKKRWPQHEFRSAQERALVDDEYILPVIIENLELPGLYTTKGYLDARQKSPEEIADLLLKKVDRDIEKEEDEVTEDDSDAEDYDESEDEEEEDWEDDDEEDEEDDYY